MIPLKSISTYISTLTISLLLLSALPADAQYGFRKKEKAEPDTVPLFRGFAVSADLMGVGMKMLGEYGQYEAALRLNLKDRYFPVFEAGIGDCDHTNDATDIRYKVRAPFFRIGADLNITKNKHDIYRLLVGARYAFSSFKYDVHTPGVKDPVWGNLARFEADGVGCYYHWAELLFGVDATIWGPFHLGWSVRYRNRLFYNQGDLDNCWYVPGYGKSKKSCFGATFNVIIDI